MSKFQNNLLYLYVFLTFFIGKSVRSWLHFDFPPTSIIGGINYLGFPILIVLFFTLKNKHFLKEEWWLIGLSVITIMIEKVLNGSAVIVNIVTNCFEPILLCCILRSANSKVIGKSGLILTCFFIVECLVAIYEASTRSILFASLEDDDLLGMQLWTMRAYSLHGHPLDNGAIVTLMSLFFIITNQFTRVKSLMLVALGFYALFCFNNRGSVYILGGCCLLYIAYYVLQGKASFLKKIFLVSAIAVAVSYVLVIMSNSDIGNRIFNSAISRNDDSTQGHLAALYFLDMLDFKGWLFGVPGDLIYGSFMRKAQAVAVESSFVLYILTYGLIYTLVYFVFLFKFILSFQTSKVMKYLIALMVFITLNTCNLIFGASPYIPLVVLCLYCFKTNFKNEVINNCTYVQR